MLLGAQTPGQVLKRNSRIERSKGNFVDLPHVSVEAGQNDHLEDDVVFGAEGSGEKG